MATASLSTSPTQIDAGSSDNVSVTNTGTVDVVVARGAQSFTLRPTQARVVYPEGVAVTAATVSGSGSVSYTATAARLSQQAQFAADPAFTGTYGPTALSRRLRSAADAARLDNPFTRGVMATPPTVTAATSTNDATLTNKYLASSASKANATWIGGTFWLIVAGGQTGNAIVTSVTQPSGTGNALSAPTNSPNANTFSWAVEFFTDAPKVELRVPGVSQTWMAEVDGQPIASTGQAYANATTGANYILFDFTSAGGAKQRRIRFEQRLASALYSIAVGPTYTVWPTSTQNGVRVASVGDSVDAGTGVTLANGVWSQVAGKLLGWTDVRQVALGGTGWVNAGGLNTFGSTQRVADAVAVAPDLLLLTASQNDDGSSAATITAAALAGFQAYRAALPNTPIVVRGAVAGSTGPSATRLANEAAVLAAFTAWGDSRSWWIPVSNDPAGSWESGTGTTGATTGTGNRDRFGFDSSHPNDLGHQNIGYRFARSFREIVLPYL